MLELVSPACIRLSIGAWQRQLPLMVMIQASETDTRIRVAARHAFWDQPRAALLSVAAEIEADVCKTDDAATLVLNNVIKGVKGGTDAGRRDGLDATSDP